VKPWRAGIAGSGLPYNAATNKPYRGVNVPLLFMCGAQYSSNGWMTYRQAQALGAHVRKGEKGALVVFFKPFRVVDRNATPDASGNLPEKTIPLLRSYVVFNVDQIDGLPARITSPKTEAERPTHSVADAMLALATVKHGGDSAYYVPSSDYICMPPLSAFSDAPNYYATALHELTHWTGHKDRCARDFSGRFGDEQYAREELVAELGAAFLCAHAGIDGKLQHPSYIASWLKVLKNDKRAVVVAASLAQRAADYVLEKSGACAPDVEAEEHDDAEAVAA
jgi:antirestriction protein ArdC